MRTIIDCLQEFRTAKEANPTFDNINLNHIDFTTESIDHIQMLAQEIISNPQLRHIDLAHTRLGLITNITKIQPLFTAIKQNCQIISINLADNQLYSANSGLWQLLIETLAQDSNIKQLELDGNKLGQSAIEYQQYVQAFLSGILSRAEKLNLADNCLSKDLLETINVGIDNNNRLSELNISLNNLGNINPEVLVIFFGIIRKKQNITALDISDNELELINTDDIAQCLQLLAQATQHLVSLEISGNNLAAIGADEFNNSFFVIISPSTTLQFLGLSDNSFGMLLEIEDQLINYIITFLQLNKSLTTINLRNNNIPLPIQQEIVEKVKDNQQLKVILDFEKGPASYQRLTTVLPGGLFHRQSSPSPPQQESDAALLYQIGILIIANNPQLLEKMREAKSLQIQEFAHMLKMATDQQYMP